MHIARFLVFLLPWMVIIFAVCIYAVVKKNVSKEILGVVLITFFILPILSIFRFGSYQSGDLSIHVIKAMDFYYSWQSGVILPEWSPLLNAGYGYPHFQFSYILPYYIIGFFHAVGFSFLFSTKLLLSFAYVLGGCGMYVLVRKISSVSAGWIAAFLYVCSPYFLMDLHFRVALGEVVALAILPWTCWSLLRWMERKSIARLWCASGLFALLMLSHQAIVIQGAMLSFTLVMVYGFTRQHIALKKIPLIFLPYLLGLGMTAFYWVPQLLEAKYTQQMHSDSIQFQPFWTHFVSPWRLGFLFQGPMGELAFVMGVPWVLLTIYVARQFLLKKFKTSSLEHNLLVVCFIILLITVSLLHPGSALLWRIIPLIGKFQFAYRFMATIIFVIAIIGGIGLGRWKNLERKVLVTVLIVSFGFLNWGNRMTYPEWGDEKLQSQIAESTYLGEGLYPAAPVWTDAKNPWQPTTPPKSVEIVSGSGEIIETSRKATERQYSIQTVEPLSVRFHLNYFPGWKLLAQEGEIPIAPDVQQVKGIIVATLPAGSYPIRLQYHNTPVRHWSKVVSAISVGLCLISLFGRKIMTAVKYFSKNE